jgi:hypothetical protein
MSNKYSGMTVNERLYASGLLSEFDEAVKQKNVSKVISILKDIGLTDESSINPILQQLGLI